MNGETEAITTESSLDFEEYVDLDPDSYDGEIRELLEQNRQIKELLEEIRDDNRSNAMLYYDNIAFLREHITALVAGCIWSCGLCGLIVGLLIVSLLKR